MAEARVESVSYASPRLPPGQTLELRLVQKPINRLAAATFGAALYSLHRVTVDKKTGARNSLAEWPVWIYDGVLVLHVCPEAEAKELARRAQTAGLLPDTVTEVAWADPGKGWAIQ